MSGAEIDIDKVKSWMSQFGLEVEPWQLAALDRTVISPAVASRNSYRAMREHMELTRLLFVQPEDGIDGP